MLILMDFSIETKNIQLFDKKLIIVILELILIWRLIGTQKYIFIRWGYMLMFTIEIQIDCLCEIYCILLS